MLHQPIFNDHDINESLYQALIHRLIQSLSPWTQTLLKDCIFGIAPNSAGVKTFFVLAPTHQAADELIQDHVHLLQRVDTLMAGIGQLAICIAPPRDPREDAPKMSCSPDHADSHLPQYMMCKLFQLPGENQESSHSY